MSDSDHDSSKSRPKQTLIPIRRETEIDLLDFLRVLWRRKMAIFSTVVLVTALSVVAVFQIAPRYASTALVIIDPRETQVVNIDAVVSGLPGDVETIASEIEIMQSRGLAEKAIQKLMLYDDPEFNPSLRPVNFWQSTATALRDFLQAMVGGTPEVPASVEDEFDKERIEIINSFTENLRIDRRGRSRVIEITFESETPRTAMLGANAIADLYLVEQLEATFDATQRATVWLSDRLASLRDSVEVAESAVEAFRKQAGLIEGEHSSLAAQQISELNTQLVLARSARAEAEARLRQVTNLIKSSDGVDSVAEVLASPLIQNLREQEAQVDRRIAELSNEYGEKHPRMISVRAEMADLKVKIQNEVEKIVQNLRNEVSVARAREGSLNASLKQMEQRITEMNASEIQLRALQREANASRELYETFLARFKETRAQEELQQIDARVIAHAELPTIPSFPRKGLFIAAVFIGSILLGIILAFVIEQLDQGFRSMTQVEEITGRPSLGMVPTVSNRNMKPEQFVVENPISSLSESIRTIYTSIILSNVDSPPKVVLVTSAQPQEGKTTIALLLTRIFALLGKRSVIVDADLRRPEVHSRLGLAAAPGLVEVLSAEASLAEVLARDEASGADILPVGKAGPNAAELLNSERLEELIEQLRQSYDLVIIDSPPSMAVADARLLAHLADATILVVRWAKTPRNVVAMVAKQIHEAGGRIAGIVLSRVNVRQHAGYGYGDSGMYYGTAQKYYSK